jgi:hypothetical protein
MFLSRKKFGSLRLLLRGKKNGEELEMVFEKETTRLLISLPIRYQNVRASSEPIISRDDIFLRRRKKVTKFTNPHRKIILKVEDYE